MARCATKRTRKWLSVARWAMAAQTETVVLDAAEGKRKATEGTRSMCRYFCPRVGWNDGISQESEIIIPQFPLLALQDL